jgi:hypothetical protein
MKYPRIIVTSGAAMLCALSAPVVWGQTRPVAGSAIGIGSYQMASAMQDKEIASAMDQEVSRRISQAWSEDKDASGAEAFQENGEIALREGKEQAAKGYFQAALRELAGLEAGRSGGVSSAVSYQPPDESASAMDQEVSRRIKEAWAQGKDATGAAAFQESGEIALSAGREQEAKKDFQAAQQELARIRGGHNGSGMSADQ